MFAVRRIGGKLLLAGLVTGTGVVVAAKLWAASITRDTASALQLATSAQTSALNNQSRLVGVEEAVADLVLLRCAQAGLNRTERLICQKYEPRLPQ